MVKKQIKTISIEILKYNLKIMGVTTKQVVTFIYPRAQVRNEIQSIEKQEPE